MTRIVCWLYGCLLVESIDDDDDDDEDEDWLEEIFSTSSSESDSKLIVFEEEEELLDEFCWFVLFFLIGGSVAFEESVDFSLVDCLLRLAARSILSCANSFSFVFILVY